MPSEPRHYDPHDMALRGRMGAYSQQANNDTRETTRAAREVANVKRYLDMVDPDRVLPEDERMRRAMAKRREHMVRNGRLSGQARRAKSRRQRP
jgi:hypothetical protein